MARDSDFKEALVELTKAIKDLTREESNSAQASRTPRFALEQGLAEPDAPAAEGPRGPLRGYRSHGDTSGSGDFGADLKGGIFGQLGGGILGSIPKVLTGAVDYAASKTPYGTTGTTDELGQNLQMGALKTLAGFAENVPGLGAFAKKQFEGLEEAVYAPEQRARGRLSPLFESMARAGIDVPDQEIREAFKYALPVERRGVDMKQTVDRLGSSQNAIDAVSHALSRIGC